MPAGTDRLIATPRTSGPTLLGRRAVSGLGGWFAVIDRIGPSLALGPTPLGVEAAALSELLPGVGGGLDVGEIADHHAGVDLGGVEALVAQPILHEPDVGPPSSVVKDAAV